LGGTFCFPFSLETTSGRSFQAFPAIEARPPRIGHLLYDQKLSRLWGVTYYPPKNLTWAEGNGTLKGTTHGGGGGRSVGICMVSLPRFPSALFPLPCGTDFSSGFQPPWRTLNLGDEHSPKESGGFPALFRYRFHLPPPPPDTPARLTTRFFHPGLFSKTAAFSLPFSGTNGSSGPMGKTPFLGPHEGTPWECPLWFGGLALITPYFLVGFPLF